MEYKDYKDEWEDFFSTPMRFSFNSCSMDLARISDQDAEDLAESLTEHLISNFAHKNSRGRFHIFSNLSNWATQYVRKELFDKCVALINKSREEDKKNDE